MNGHSHARDAPKTLSRPLILALTITASFTVIELVGGILSDSLALMSDAGHMFTDTLAIGLSLAAMKVAMRPANAGKTFGYLRAEILAALVNGASLVFISVLIIYESWRRLTSPPEIDANLMLIVASLGLVANGAGVYLLHDRSKATLNERGAFLHMFGDLLSSVAVIVGALVMIVADVWIVDPILSVMISVIILAGAWKLVTQSTSILLESTPSHIDLEDLSKGLMGIDGVTGIHDLHVWTLSSGLHAMSAHLVVKDRMLSDCSGVVQMGESMLRERFGISHTTIQVECDRCEEAACVFDHHK